MGDRLTFLGHSTVLVELDGVRVLTDPVFGHVGAGALRRQVPAIAAVSVGDVAVVFISHGHHDHLDVASLRAIPGQPLVVVPAGLGRIASAATAGEVHEVHAGDLVTVGAVVLEAIHAEHGLGRIATRRPGHALGLLLRGSADVYFAGDTDLFPGMDALTGRVDHALLPVGGWGPRLGPGHLDPARAAEAVRRIAPAVVTPIHWGTFYPLGMRRVAGHWFERPMDAFRAAVADGAGPGEVRVLQPGESTPLDGRRPR